MEEKVLLAIKGEKDSYQNLIEGLSTYLYNIAISILRNDEEAADAIGNTILKAYQKLNTIKEPKYFKTWICNILANECRDMLRKNKKVVSIEEYVLNEKTEYKNNTNNEEKMDVIEAINKLDTRQRDVIILYYYNELKIEEIAKLLGIPIGTVKSRMQTAKNNLYVLLKERSGEQYEQ